MQLSHKLNRTQPRVGHGSKRAAVVAQAVTPAAPLDASRRQLVLGGLAVLAGGMAQASPAIARPPTIAEISKGGPGERDMLTTATGLRFSNVSTGTGPVTKSGDLVLVDVVGTLEGGKVFLDTRALGAPLAFQVGTSNKYVPEGLSQVVEGMVSGSVRLAVLPPSLGYGEKNVAFPGGVSVPPNSKLYYEIELLRCETLSMGLACCSESVFNKNGGSCLKNKDAAEAREKALAAASAAN